MTRNWAGTYEYTAPRIVDATSIDDVRRLSSRAPGRVRALGTRHSFTDLPDTTGTLVDVTGLEPGFALDEQERTVTVGAGTRYGELAVWLEERGWALRNMGSLPHINVGGAIATGTHGSGDRNQVLSASVRAMRYVGADAEVHEVRRGDADFDALVVGLGAYGITVAVTLDIQPSFRMRQDIYTGVSWDAALGDLRRRHRLRATACRCSRSGIPRRSTTSGSRRGSTTTTMSVPDTILDGVRAAGGESPLGVEDNVTELAGVPGPWMLRLPHFRLDAQPSFGDEIQTEYFVDRRHAPDALRAVRGAGRRHPPAPHLDRAAHGRRG